jgi:tRNA-splicing ligase RtcB
MASERGNIERKGPCELLIRKTGSMLVDASVFASERIWEMLEDGAISQLEDAASIPGVAQVAGTPDMHVGFGVPIGCVMAMKDAVVPSAVGYDINCGMRLLTTPLKAAEVNAPALAQSIHRDIPLGEGQRNVSVSEKELREILADGVGALRSIKGHTHRAWDARDAAELDADLKCIEDEGAMEGNPAAVSERAVARGKDQLATLGGGNHFIELQRVQSIGDAEAAKRFGLFEGQFVIMIHSGSRGLGHQVGGEYMKQAARMSGSKCPNSSTCFLPMDSKEGAAYAGAMNAAANFAFANREIMTWLVRRNVRHMHPNVPIPLVYDVPHNMAKLETHGGGRWWIHRKGATRAYDAERMAGTPFADAGQPVLIPGSMGTASYLLLAGANADRALFSVNHGAGRVMSRTQAAGVYRGGKYVRPPAISQENFRESMSGIALICEDKRAILEEAPAAYKDIDLVIDTVVRAGLGRVVARMVPLAVLKG